jgi:hypothetical protein
MLIFRGVDRWPAVRRGTPARRTPTCRVLMRKVSGAELLPLRSACGIESGPALFLSGNRLCAMLLRATIRPSLRLQENLVQWKASRLQRSLISRRT